MEKKQTDFHYSNGDIIHIGDIVIDDIEYIKDVVMWDDELKEITTKNNYDEPIAISDMKCIGNVFDHNSDWKES